MEDLGINTHLLQQKIDDIVRLTLLAVQDEYINNYKSTVKTQDDRSRLFEILGFDIFIDEDLKPWLIEVNKNPSLKAKSDFDISIKTSVVKGTLEILDLNTSFKQEVIQRQKQLKGKQNISKLPPLFNPEHESIRASKTNWRQIFPA
jgi:tubulin polyglutamylase TTLL6/13